jgi:autotransporter-associated beta strand protein
MKCALSIEDGKLYVKIETMRDASTIEWKGTENGLWDLDNTANFMKGDAPSTFVTGDDVFFGDDASTFTVDINTDIEADSVFVENTKAYTFQGTGAITGNTTLLKRGKGNLTIKTDNTYTGGNRISGGAVIVSSLANANQPKGNLGAMTTAASKFVIENGGELRTTAAVTNGSAIRFEGETGGSINNQADFISDRAMTGTTLTKKGSGWMKLNVSNTGLNKMVIIGGTVQCINANVPAKAVEFQGGTLRENTGTSYPIHIPANKKGIWYMANRSTYTNKVTGQGTLTAYCITEKGTNYYATRTPVQCDFSEFEGTLIPTSSLDDPAVLRFTLNRNGGMPKGTMDIAKGVEVQNSGNTFRIGKVIGEGALGGSCTFSNGGSVGANTWQVGNDDNWTTSVKVTSNANLVKLGAGKVTWNATNTNTGITAINEGELSINDSQLGTGKLTIGENGTFSGKNTDKTPIANASVEVKGTLRPGLYVGSYTGSIYFNNKAVTFTETSSLVIYAGRAAGTTTNGCTSMEGVGNLTMNGTIRVIPTNNNRLSVGDSIRVWRAASATGTPTVNNDAGITWDDSRLMSEGLLFVKDIDLGISDTKTSNIQPARDIYDLRGRLVRKDATSTEGLPEGIYIQGGKKIVVKK